MGFKSFTRSVEQLRPDPRYQNRLIAKFINCLMYEGKKSVAIRQFYGALDIIAKKVKDGKPHKPLAGDEGKCIGCHSPHETPYPLKGLDRSVRISRGLETV